MLIIQVMQWDAPLPGILCLGFTSSGCSELVQSPSGSAEYLCVVRGERPKGRACRFLHLARDGKCLSFNPCAACEINRYLLPFPVADVIWSQCAWSKVAMDFPSWHGLVINYPAIAPPGRNSCLQGIKKAASLSLALARIVSHFESGDMLHLANRDSESLEPFSMKHHLFFFGQGRVVCRCQNHGSPRIPAANG